MAEQIRIKTKRRVREQQPISRDFDDREVRRAKQTRDRETQQASEESTDDVEELLAEVDKILDVNAENLVGSRERSIGNRMLLDEIGAWDVETYDYLARTAVRPNVVI